jgi:hypothetical protein
VTPSSSVRYALPPDAADGRASCRSDRLPVGQAVPFDPPVPPARLPARAESETHDLRARERRTPAERRWLRGFAGRPGGPTASLPAAARPERRKKRPNPFRRTLAFPRARVIESESEAVKRCPDSLLALFPPGTASGEGSAERGAWTSASPRRCRAAASKPAAPGRRGPSMFSSFFSSTRLQILLSAARRSGRRARPSRLSRGKTFVRSLFFA